MRNRLVRKFLYSVFLTLSFLPSPSQAEDRGLYQALTLNIQEGILRPQANPDLPGSENPGPAIPGEDSVYLPDRRCNLGFSPQSALTPIQIKGSLPFIQETKILPPGEEKQFSPAFQGEIFAEANTGETPNDLEQRLENCPILRNHIRWETGNGQRIPYPDWEPEQKQRLNDLFYKLIRGESDLDLQCPQPSRSFGRGGLMFLSAEEAFDVFAAHVAHVLYVEARRLVPWSVALSTEGELDQLLASYNYQSIIRPSSENNYPEHILPTRDFQQTTAAAGTVALLCDPRVGYRFLTGTSPQHRFQTEYLIGINEEETLIRLTSYLRKNLAHGGGESQAQLLRRALLKDRLRLEDRGMIWATAGCHGASQLIQDLARSINIPLLNIGTQENPSTSGHYGSRTHRGLIYEWEGPRARILWHADEIYAISYTDPVFAIDDSDRPLSPEASQRLFFERYWPSPRTLQAWGFQYRPHIVFPEIGFGVNSRGIHEDYADYGWMGGHWLPSDRAEAFLATGRPWDAMSIEMYGDLAKQFHLENLYQTCGWDLLQDFLDNEAGGLPAFRERMDYRWGNRQRSGLSVQQMRPIEEYWNRARACVTAHGGGARIEELRAQWEHNRGYPGFALASTEALTTINPSVWEEVR